MTFSNLQLLVKPKLQIHNSFTISRKKKTVILRFTKVMILQKVLLMLQLIIILNIKNNHSHKYHLLLNLIVRGRNPIVIKCQVRIFHFKTIIMDNKAQKIYCINKVHKRSIFLINKCKMHTKTSRIFIRSIIRIIMIIKLTIILIRKAISK